MAKTNKNKPKDIQDDFKYSEEQISELIRWFKGKDLPKSLRLDSGTYITDVRRTVSLMSEIVANKMTHAFESTAEQLFKIKALCEQQSGSETTTDDETQKS